MLPSRTLSSRATCAVTFPLVVEGSLMQCPNGGVFPTDLWLDTSTKSLRPFYTSPQPILGKTSFIINVYIIFSTTFIIKAILQNEQSS
jgi:hypothetical protein